jgi:hypothetical protein
MKSGRRLMSDLIVDGMGDNRADTRSRVANCSGFFGLDEFDARPVDTCAFAAGIELKECSTFASFRCACLVEGPPPRLPFAPNRPSIAQPD